MDFEKLSPLENIIIKGARVNNLKNVDVYIPKNKLTVITGLSGSGKSSLAFDTLYAEGQRRYVESLSSYARQFLSKMNKPEVDYIKGISPAIAIEQRVLSTNPRSTVGTVTEIYEYLKLLYARLGKTYSPVSGNEVKRHSVTDVVDFLLNAYLNKSVLITTTVAIPENRNPKEQLNLLIQQGYSRMLNENKIAKIEEVLQQAGLRKLKDIVLVVDRCTVKDDAETLHRIADSVQIAFFEGKGKCTIYGLEADGTLSTDYRTFSNLFEEDGISFEEPTPEFFSFNNPYGACKSCEGFGKIIGIDEDLVIPDKSLSVYEDAVVCWRGEKLSEWKDELVMNAYKFNFPIHKPIFELTDEEYRLLWEGNHYFGGINGFFKYVEENLYKIQYRVLLARYRGKTLCPECKGTRLRKETRYVKINGYSINELVELQLTELLKIISSFTFCESEQIIAKRLITELTNRIGFMCDVGLGYLTLNRASNTLSGGESQRMNLAKSLGSSLVGSMYILDEPTIGLHPRDTHRLLNVLKNLRNIGNTVIVVEHDKEVMLAADHIVDLGPEAGNNGGYLVYQGSIANLEKAENSYTASYLFGRRNIERIRKPRQWKEYITVEAAKEHNLKNISVRFPLNSMVVVTGVSGSGKTTLVQRILYQALSRHFNGSSAKPGKFLRLSGDLNRIYGVELIDQNPIGKSTRSNPVTYIKAFDEIRVLFANQQLAKMRGYKPGFFSFNIPGGRCDECEGEGEVKIEMQFMSDLKLVCESCNGKRYKEEVLEIKYRDKNISDILDMTVDEALLFFSGAEKKSSTESKIIEKLQPLADVGLGYVRLGQSSSSLSGGEAQRVKLASFLVKGNAEKPMLFVFDEPTTGLHFHDIQKLLVSLNALIDKGHSVIIIEHNPDVIKNADWIIDLGPEGGEEGGYVVFEGTPDELVLCKKSYTGQFLKDGIIFKQSQNEQET